MKKRGLLIAGIAAVVLLAPMLYVLVTFMGMRSAETGEIRPGLWVIKGSIANMYVMRTATGLVAFDAGDNRDETAKAFAVLGLDPNAVEAVFLTHSDKDHTTALPLFPGAAVYISKEETSMLDGSRPRRLFFGLMPRFSSIEGREVRSLADGENIRVGGAEILLILTPGHTVGSASILADGKYLFIGDLLLTRDGRAEVMSGIVTEDGPRSEQSIRILANLRGLAVVGTAHSGYVTDTAKLFENWK